MIGLDLIEQFENGVISLVYLIMYLFVSFMFASFELVLVFHYLGIFIHNFETVITYCNKIIDSKRNYSNSITFNSCWCL